MQKFQSRLIKLIKIKNKRQILNILDRTSFYIKNRSNLTLKIQKMIIKYQKY
jgi:hypothetical protein